MPPDIVRPRTSLEALDLDNGIVYEVLSIPLDERPDLIWVTGSEGETRRRDSLRFADVDAYFSSLDDRSRNAVEAELNGYKKEAQSGFTQLEGARDETRSNRFNTELLSNGDRDSNPIFIKVVDYLYSLACHVKGEWPKSADEATRLREAIKNALTHASNETKEYAMKRAHKSYDLRLGFWRPRVAGSVALREMA